MLTTRPRRFAHARAGVDRVEGTVQVHVDRETPALGGVLQGGGLGRDRRVVDEQIAASPFGVESLDDANHRVFVAHVEGDRPGAAARLGHRVRSLFDRAG
jgi:hypothetical protein